MIHPKTETDIKAVRDFIEFWTKFHAMYSETIARERITHDDEKRFFETKALISAKYDELERILDYAYVTRSRPSDPVRAVLAIDNIRLVSEENIAQRNNDWRDSYVLLNSILERLVNNRRRFEQFNPFGVFVKRFIETLLAQPTNTTTRR